ncbi:N-acetylmuramoyl-L-alanine amidase [Nocardia yamanashiensis]|uniref:N-acetylmuramoyl-L-alanine amidase n=1 Tax=Nocardia yamanashiensis TaxID=209247 RepID=UPI001F36DC69|nr:N-acetylmuramoyl-L-alanine amidase [Nocardia yamanashiensis]
MRQRRWKLMAAVCGALLIGGSAQVTAAPVAKFPAAPLFPIAGRTIVLDPGHNGGGAAHPEVINSQVSDGRGGTKACNTTGTAANDGYTEHEFNWDVAQRVRDLLTARGYQVIMSRDSGAGPCVDERGTLGNRTGAAAVVSIHADGAPAGAHGFHVAHSSPPLNQAQGEPSQRLATALRDSLVRSGFQTSTYIGSDGLNPRSDLAGLNHSDRPTALVECGNMRDPGDIAVLESADGRARLAEAIAGAVAGYVG